MRGLKKILWTLSLVATVLFAGTFAACSDVLDSVGSSKDPEETELPVRITAVYEQSAQVFSDTPLDDLRADLTVSVETEAETATETNDYTLSGTLAVGESVVTVTYNPAPTLTATFNVNVSEGNVHTHAFTNYISDNNATCEKDGTKTATCDNGCGEKDVITIENSATGHAFTNYVSDNNAACEKDGTKTATCDNGCGEKDVITIENSATGHAFTNYVSDNNAACEKDGTKTATCDNGCGKTDGVADEGTALVHIFTTYVSDGNATCQKDGTKTAECDNGCGKKDEKTDEGSKLEHVFENYVSNNDATCEADGTKKGTCKYGCGETETVADVDSALGHTYTNYVSNNNASCKADGTKTAECDNGCGKKDEKTDEGSKLEHVFENYVSNNNATCEVDGTKTGTCKYGCGETETVADVGSALGHDFTNYVSNNNATCEEDGTKTATCNNDCGKTDIITIENSAIGHAFTNYVSDNNATCEEDGTKTATCDNGCGKTDFITIENSAIGHAFTNYVSDNNATCKADGTKTAECDNGCGKKDEKTDEDSKLEHVFENYVSNNDATCEADGTKKGTCKYGCGETETVADVDSALGHSYTKYEADGNATCEADGTKTAECDNGCGKTKTVADVGSALGHSYTKYEADGNATCKADGTKTAECDNGCGKTKTDADVDSALGHTFKLGVCERCPQTNHISILTVPSVTSVYYGEQPTFTDGVVQNELGETVSSGTWSVEGLDYLASGTTKELATTATVIFTPDGTEYAPVSKEIALTLLAVAKYGDNYYATVDGALTKANANNSGTVYALPFTYDIDSGRAKIAKTIAVVNEIKSGVTLTLPYAEDALGTTVSYVLVSESSEYRTSAYGKTQFLQNQIYIAEEHTLDNAGRIDVAGEISGGTHMNYNAKANANSVTAGRHAQINLGANAKLTNTGTVNCYGFINEEEQNNGSEFIVEKGNVTVVFTIVEYRGGQRYFGMIDPSNSKVSEAIASAALSGMGDTPGKYTPDTLQASPFNRFYIESVTAKTTIKYNAQMFGCVVLFADSSNQQTTLNVINNNDAIIALTNQASSVTYKYDSSTRKTDLDIYGDMTLNPLQLQILITKSQYGVSTSIELTLTTGATGDSSGVFFPISNYFDISLNAVNGSATVNALKQKVKLLPGSKLTIEKGVVVNASEIAVYDSNELFLNGADKHYTTKTPAWLIVYGTLNAEAIGGAVKIGDDGARLNISKATSVISKEIKAMSPSKTVPITLMGITVNLPYVNVDYFSEEESTLIATGVTVNGDPLGVNEYTAQNGQWAPANITVDLMLNGGTASATSKTFGYGYQLKESDLPVPEREYYDFMGWYTTEDFVDGTRLETTALTNNLTLYAKWQQKAGIVLVEFKAVGTNVKDVEKTKTFGSQVIDENSKCAVEPAKAKECNQDTSYARYVAGYYIDEACTVEFSFSQELTENTTIYVKWEQKIIITISTTGSSTNSVTADGNQVSTTVFYVKPNTQIAVSATVSGGILSKKTVKVSGGGQENSKTTSWTGGSATASITFTATDDTTVSITVS